MTLFFIYRYDNDCDVRATIIQVTALTSILHNAMRKDRKIDLYTAAGFPGTQVPYPVNGFLYRSQPKTFNRPLDKERQYDKKKRVGYTMSKCYTKQ